MIINAVRPDCIGFIFAHSKRQVTLEKAQMIKKLISPLIKTAGVFVDETKTVIIDTAHSLKLDIIQLHGNETEEDIKEIRQAAGCSIWKAVRVKDSSDIEKWRNSSADMLLFDTFSRDAAGGTGKEFDWSILGKFDRPFILAGGLCGTNIVRAIRKVSPWGVDINSGVETNGVKDPAKINEIMSIIRRLK